MSQQRASRFQPHIEFVNPGESPGDANALQHFDVIALAPEPIDRPQPAVKRLTTAEGVNLIAMTFTAGQELPNHRAAHPITVQVVQGELTFAVGGESTNLRPGQICHLPAMVPHSVSATTEAILLLSMLT